METFRNHSKQYVYKATVKTMYGLTDKMIEELGKPDKMVANPHYASGPKASLYLIERVELWVEANSERVEKVLQHRASLPPKKSPEDDSARAELERAQAELEQTLLDPTYREKITTWAQLTEISLSPIPDDIRRVSPYRFDGVISHIRHRLTNYDSLLVELEGISRKAHSKDWPADRMAYQILKDRVNQVIEKRLTEMSIIRD